MTQKEEHRYSSLLIELQTLNVEVLASNTTLISCCVLEQELSTPQSPHYCKYQGKEGWHCLSMTENNVDRDVKLQHQQFQQYKMFNMYL